VPAASTGHRVDAIASRTRIRDTPG
jgi:hypothetical protein